jgi:hypothetical protein
MKMYVIQYANFNLVVNIVSKEKKKEYYCRIDLRNITQYFAARTRAADHEA